MTPREAFAAIALVAVACDGSLDRQEAQALREQLEGRHPYRQASEEEMGNLFDALLQRLRREGWQSLLAQAIPVLNAPQQETALAMAAQLVRSDRVLRPEEEELLNTMAEQLMIPRDRCQQILDVIAILHRDSLAV
ncbi:MAG: tellurite resistance TerB family protein [Cyanobacteriota bacterium]|nr:tellurite resistance TerB family protein [Cyanobacteriota bacterium]